MCKKTLTLSGEDIIFESEFSCEHCGYMGDGYTPLWKQKDQEDILYCLSCESPYLTDKDYLKIAKRELELDLESYKNLVKSKEKELKKKKYQNL